MEPTMESLDELAPNPCRAVLVCSASRHGSTAELAREVALTISTAIAGRVPVHCQDISSDIDLDEYSDVIVGSAVYLGRWMRDARLFIERHEAELRKKRTWLFCSGPVGGMPASADADHDMARFAARVSARDARMFDGRLTREGLSMSERAVTRLGHAPTGDFRDIRAVRQWAHDVAAEIGAGVDVEVVPAVQAIP